MADETVEAIKEPGMKKTRTLVACIALALLLSGCGSHKEKADEASEDAVLKDMITDTVPDERADVTELVPVEPVYAGETEVTSGDRGDLAADAEKEQEMETVSQDIAVSENTGGTGDTVSGAEVSENAAALDAVSENDVTVSDEEESAGDTAEETAGNTGAAARDPEGVFTSEMIPDAVFARMSGVSFPADCTISREDLRYLRLSYNDFNGQTQVGELVCNKKIADDLIEIFRELYKSGYQIEKIRLIDDYGGDDDLSCADNNTSCFNYRTVAGSTNLSKHAMGVAVDINPFYNPYVTYPNGVERISPPGSEPYADRSADFPHKIGPGDMVYELFKAHGFTWGGNWKSLKDYQHFQKP